MLQNWYFLKKTSFMFPNFIQSRICQSVKPCRSVSVVRWQHSLLLVILKQKVNMENQIINIGYYFKDIFGFFFLFLFLLRVELFSKNFKIPWFGTFPLNSTFLYPKNRCQLAFFDQKLLFYWQFWHVCLTLSD